MISLLFSFIPFIFLLSLWSISHEGNLTTLLFSVLVFYLQRLSYYMQGFLGSFTSYGYYGLFLFIILHFKILSNILNPIVDHPRYPLWTTLQHTQHIIQFLVCGLIIFWLLFPTEEEGYCLKIMNIFL